MTETKLTKAQIKTLEWFAAQKGPVADFSRQGPTANMQRWAARKGFVAIGAAGRQITEAGRSALQQGGGDHHG